MGKRSVRTAFFIAWRYLFSKKKHNLINIISLISTVGIAASAAALVIVLSVFNGIESLVRSNFNAFNPDFRITLVEGKSFAVDSFPIRDIAALSEIKSVQEIVTDMVLLEYEEKQILIKLKGVGEDYFEVNKMEDLVIDGDFFLYDRGFNYGVMGIGAAGTIQLNLNNPELLQLYYPKRTKRSFVNTADAFNRQSLIPSGVFATFTQYDDEFLFSDIGFARDLMDYHGQVSSLEIFLHEKANVEKCRKDMARIAGDKYLIRDKYQQEESLYKTMKSEKLIIFFILAIIVVVAAFNIIGTMGMLIIEKKEDISILRSLGATSSFIEKIFVLEGLIVSFLGGIAGMVIGALTCFLQETFHIVKFGSGDGYYILDHYPVAMEISDFLLILFLILVISLLASWLPTKIIRKNKAVK